MSEFTEDLIARLSSRKFLAAVVGGIVAVLAAADVIEPSNTQTIIAQVTPLAYIVVQGILEFFEDR